MYVLMKERIDHARVRVLAQLVLDKDKGAEAFEEYMSVAYPWIQTAQKEERKKLIDKLVSEVKGGALVIESMGAPKRIKSRLAAAAATPVPSAPAATPVRDRAALNKFAQGLSRQPLSEKRHV